VVFVNVRGFTSLSERLPPGEVVARLNLFYKAAADVVFDLDGTFDKAVGDQVMAFFGVPFRPQDLAQRVVTAAIGLSKPRKIWQRIRSFCGLVAELEPAKLTWATSPRRGGTSL
jgi:adenylate cyclase